MTRVMRWLERFTRAALVPLGAVCTLTACETLRLPSHPTAVNVPVPVSCLPDELPVAPTIYTDAELLALDEYKLPRQLFIDRGLLQIYLRRLEIILKACK